MYSVVVRPVVPVDTAAQFANPPMNEPQVTPARFSRSPTFCPDIVIWVRFGFEHTSPAGSGSPTTAPLVAALAIFPPAPRPFVIVASKVLPATRFRRPGVDGPKVVLKELSLIAKCCA